MTGQEGAPRNACEAQRGGESVLTFTPIMVTELVTGNQAD